MIIGGFYKKKQKAVETKRNSFQGGPKSFGAYGCSPINSFK
jgi:hypothetical protein